MTLRRVTALCALIAVGLVAAASGQDMVTDHQSVPIEQAGEPQEVGPISLLGLDIPEGFPVELFLDVTHTVRVDVGAQSFTSVGIGGAVSSTGQAFLEAGRTYGVRERYDFTATVDSAFIDGAFAIQDEVTWEFVAPRSGRYRYTIDGSTRDFSLSVSGDVEGDADLEVIGDVIGIAIATTREIPADSLMTYTGAFVGTFERTANAEFVAADTPPWDVDASGVTDIVDLVRVARAFGQVGEAIEGDIDASGRVDIIDLVTVAAHFGESLAIAGAPGRVAYGAAAEVRTSVTRDVDGDATLAVEMSPGAVAGVAADVWFDAGQWEPVWADAGERLQSAVIVASDAPAGTARLVAVSIPTAGGPTSGRLARFRFRPLRGDADASRIQLRDIQLADPNGARIAIVSGYAARTRTSSGARVAVGQNYPNPFNPETWIPFAIPEAGDVTLTVFGQGGASVRTLHLGALDAGDYRDRDRAAYWDGRNSLGEAAPSGVYFYRLESQSGSATGRMVIAK